MKEPDAQDRNQSAERARHEDAARYLVEHAHADTTHVQKSGG